ncbi:MAG: esterase family protein [Clostridia bacterium]|nr:esterase family protein [Clostridia bacterium]
MALMHVHFRSQVLELNLSMSVIIPEEICPHRGGKWPTLYLLHGLSDNHTIWQRHTSIERYVQDRNIAVIMPEVHRSFYTDMHHGGQYWTFISEELPVLAERLFPLSSAREDRFAAGLSMGGYGAFKLGLRLPERYAAVASLSGAVDMAELREKAEPDAVRHFWDDVFGSAESARGGEDDLAAVATRLIASGRPLPRMFMACGTEDFLYENNKSFLARFQKPLDIQYIEGPGDHSWAFWDAYIQRVLDWLPIRSADQQKKNG